MESHKPKVCVVSFPNPSVEVVSVLLYELVEILAAICERIYVVTGYIPRDRTMSKNVIPLDLKLTLRFRDSIQPEWWSTVLQFLKIVAIQIKMCYYLAKVSKEIDAVIFYVGVAEFLPVVLTAKVLRKKVVASASGLGSSSYKYHYSRRFWGISRIYPATLRVLERTVFSLSDRILVQSEGVIDFLGLDKYRQKIVASGARYVNTNIMQIKVQLDHRNDLVGYIGRLEEGKGVMNFIEAIPLFLAKRDSFSFLLGGHGPLYEKIGRKLQKDNLFQSVEMSGWIPHHSVPDYLNQLKLLVLPSYSEGLPTIVLEAMACGTPVLATPVGGIPDVIKDGETGFLMESNSPDCIVENLERALRYPNLMDIARNARNLIEQRYSYEGAVRRYKDILYDSIL